MMAIDLYSTAVMRAIVANLNRPSRFLLDRYFRRVQQSTTPDILFDRKEGSPRLAPFVSPLVAGQVVEREGYKTDTFRPAYVKPKRLIHPKRALQRMAGEQIGGSLTPQQRAEAILREDLAEMAEMISNREEWMAAHALLEGHYTVEGENYAAKNVDFKRDPDLTDITDWSDLTFDILGYLERCAAKVQDKSGAVATDVVLDPKAAQLLSANDKVAALLDRRRGGEPTLKVDPIAGNGRGVYARDRGEIGDFHIFVYQWKYADEDGAQRQIMPDNSMIMVDPNGVEGVRHYGAIEDHDANLVADQVFFKSWVEPDPSGRVILGQSAPLVVPTVINATFRASVGG